MTFRTLTATGMALALSALPLWAQSTDTADQTQATTQTNASSDTKQPEQSATDPSSAVMFGQFNAIRAQLKLKPIDKAEREQMHHDMGELSTEAQTVLGANATPQEIRSFFEARSAGYQTVADMNADIETVLGPNANPGAIKAYLKLRRAESEGLAGRKTDYNALRAEVTALEKINPGTLQLLLKSRTGPGNQPEQPENATPDQTTSNTSGANVQNNVDVNVQNNTDVQDKTPPEQQGGMVADAEMPQTTHAEAQFDDIKAKIETRLAAVEANQENMPADAEAHYAEAKDQLDARLDAQTSGQAQGTSEAQANYEKARADLEAKMQDVETKTETVQAQAKANADVQIDLTNQHKSNKNKNG